MKKHIIITSIITSIMILSGCASVDNDNQNKEVKREEQTLWQVLDKSGEIINYLDEDNADVKDIKNIVTKHKAIIDNREPENIMYNEEVSLYTEEFKKILIDNRYEEALNSMYYDNEMSLVSGNIIWYISTFDESEEYCKVTIDSEFEIKHSKEKYLKNSNLKLNNTYVEQRIIYFKKQNGEWLISNITKSALNEKSKT